MEKLNVNTKKDLLGGFKIKNNSIFAGGLFFGMLSSIINDATDIVANDILASKGFKVSYKYNTPFMRIGSNANNSAILF